MLGNIIAIFFIIVVGVIALAICEIRINSIMEELKNVSYILEPDKFRDLDGEISYFSVLQALVVMVMIMSGICTLRG